MKIGAISLGCDKNRVDTEKMLSRLVGGGHTLVGSEEEAEVIIVNTCAFIDKAKEESIRCRWAKKQRQRGGERQKDGDNRLCIELSHRFGHRNTGTAVSYPTLPYLGLYSHHSSLYRALSGHYPVRGSFHDHFAHSQQHDAFPG